MMITNHKIIAFPFAGGNRYSFSSIEKHVPKNIDWITLELPGRGNRFKENLLVKIDDMVDDLLDKIIPHIQKSDYIIYGHSMGTLLGYELTKRIIQEKLKLPKHLFFTGRGAPGFDRFKNKKSTLPKELFWKEVIEMGGFPNDILDHEDLLDLYFPIMKSDFKAVEDYEFCQMKKPFLIPIHICMGNEEIGEEEDKTPLSSMKAWSNETSYSCSFELLKGDHFFILKHPKTIAQKICFAFEGKLNTK
ncbi:thioesterase II family protein [Aquimarina longa]|uniref:thioesterase II family protein n=1 Tax=Aquimarina longa TaxID=1080221 RepID=UPI0007814F66|nr:thioesterase domain-containing protein [Aquimarina longa]